MKCASSLKKILFEGLPSTSIYDVVNGQLASVVVLYMDVGVDLNAKYAIMCHKTVLLPEDDESLATVSLTIALFSAQRAKR